MAVAARERPPIDEILSPQHFPPCQCFTRESDESRDRLYVLSRTLAEEILTIAEHHHLCHEAVPYLMALTTHVTLSLLSSGQVVALRGAELTEENKALFREVNMRHNGKFNERLAALVQRAERVADGGPMLEGKLS